MSFGCILSSEHRASIATSSRSDTANQTGVIWVKVGNQPFDKGQTCFAWTRINTNIFSLFR